MMLPIQLRDRLQIVGNECISEMRQASNIKLQFRKTKGKV